MTERKTGLACVKCGKNATRGSMKHPYCSGCFKKIFNNNYDKYARYVAVTHSSW